MGDSIRRMATVAALLFGVIHGNAFAASDVADAAMHGDAKSVSKLIAAKADVNAPQPDGSTALHWAAYHDDAKLAGSSLARPRQSERGDGERHDAVVARVPGGNVELVKELLKAGADPNQTLPNGETPLMMAARTGASRSSRPCWQRARRSTRRKSSAARPP